MTTFSICILTDRTAFTRILAGVVWAGGLKGHLADAAHIVLCALFPAPGCHSSVLGALDFHVEEVMV